MKHEPGTGRWSIRTCEAGELAEVLSQFPPETPVAFCNDSEHDPQKYIEVVDFDAEWDSENPVLVVLFSRDSIPDPFKK